ncbi:hypothetical protein ACJVC5_15650 [Peredibacter sp. HCB2-198]|uniref:hypothetical protein n=1 Tax=Peredibacter sp. HCB2-198 TaxID=3383025 RepID=UPI0038B58AF2
MKYLLSLLLLSTSAFAVKKFNVIEEVRDIDVDESRQELIISFWGNGKVFRISEGDAVAPCLKNAYEAQMQVKLTFEENADDIKGCKLVSPSAPVR